MDKGEAVMKQRRALQLFGALTIIGLVAAAMWPTGQDQPDMASALQASVATVSTAKDAPAPATKIFVVYFDFDSDMIVSDARETLAAALRYAESVDGARIDIAGHTDSAGPRTYNERLAERRSAAVAAEMSAGGVASAALQIAQFGETQPTVATGDGVKEARNRRVEITISA